ncbi:MAG: hypothetical protein IPO93_13910 [Actinobacteria bacterium]|jgi:hypothetical protein|nr:hypothetical protein [Actinomycetota bacterium]
MPKRQFAATRVAALSLVVFALSTSGHAAESAVLPSTLGLALTLVLSIGLTSAAVARPRSIVWLLLYLAGAQAVIHVVLVVSASSHHPTSMTVAPLLPSGMMVAAHLAVSVVAAAVLAFGERTLVAWARLLAVAIGARIIACLRLAQASAAIVAGDSVVVTLRHASWGVARRGPPALASM